VLHGSITCYFVALGPNSPYSAAKPRSGGSDRPLREGKFREAIPKYQEALKTDPKLVAAQAGLVRAYLKADDVSSAAELAKTSLAAQPASPPLLAAMGTVQYRRGEIPEAEKSFLEARKADPNLVDAYLGLAQLVTHRAALSPCL